MNQERLSRRSALQVLFSLPLLPPLLRRAFGAQDTVEAETLKKLACFKESSAFPAELDVDMLGSIPMSHSILDLFNPPPAVNFWGAVQAAPGEVTGLRGITFPPYSTGESITASLHLDGAYLAGRGTPVTYTWYPDRVERMARYRDLFLQTITCTPMNHRAALLRLKIKNSSSHTRRVQVGLMLRGAVSKKVEPWWVYSPTETEALHEFEPNRHALLFETPTSGAFAIQGTSPAPQRITGTLLHHEMSLGRNETQELRFVAVVGESAKTVREEYDLLINHFDQFEKECRAAWNTELRAVFTPNNDRYTGHLPSLITANTALQRIYLMSVVGTLIFKRNPPESVIGLTYGTLLPRYWMTTTFLWDISLSSLLHALLEPHDFRRLLETFMQADIHQHVGVEYLTGEGVGPWYSVNDYAMLRMARDYLRFTGDWAWLEKRVGQNTVLEHLDSYAQYWRTRDINGHGLADYGGKDNLLEAVSTYVHEVASLNAANVWNLRFMAEVWGLRGDLRKARAYRDEAKQLLASLMQLYVPGEGTWRCRLPDGTLQPVRHCYDFLTLLGVLESDLDATQKQEMVRFFRAELMTPTWMRALSLRDPDSSYSLRPDHQWNGAYTAWPALCLRALYRNGNADLGAKWLRGLAQTALQGPFGQAHFVESAVPPEGKGAIKATSEQPYINDWACSSEGSYLEAIVEGVFGVEAGLNGEIKATPRIAELDPQARLVNLAYRKKLYTVDRTGAHPQQAVP